MKVLLHTCCGPCSIYPIKILRNKGYDVTGYFYNPNIHPYKEFKKRLNTLENYAKEIDIPLITNDTYGLKYFLRNVVFKEDKRCIFCYTSRLESCVNVAKKSGFNAFTSTLFYSKYQNHQLMIKIAEQIAEKYDVQFIYEDFRKGWQEGIDLSLKVNMYRQPYCGCIYSEQERYDKTLKKENEC